MTDIAVPPTPRGAHVVFSEQLELAERFVRLLAEDGIAKGLIGPREAPRLWERHVLNCGVLHLLIPHHAVAQSVIDVGSGAGLPGIALAIARPDLHLHLVEPLQRRSAWLTTAVAELGLTNVTVHSTRAEALWGEVQAPWVTARAVAGILQLAEWTLPLLSGGGSLLALKGSRARAELNENLAALKRLGVTEAAVEEVGGDVLEEPATVLRLTVAHPVDRRKFRAKSPSSSGSARRRSDRPRRDPGRRSIGRFGGEARAGTGSPTSGSDPAVPGIRPGAEATSTRSFDRTDSTTAGE